MEVVEMSDEEMSKDIAMFNRGFMTEFCRICDRKFYTGLGSREVCDACLSLARSRTMLHI